VLILSQIKKPFRLSTYKPPGSAFGNPVDFSASLIAAELLYLIGSTLTYDKEYNL